MMEPIVLIAIILLGFYAAACIGFDDCPTTPPTQPPHSTPRATMDRQASELIMILIPLIIVGGLAIIGLTIALAAAGLFALRRPSRPAQPWVSLLSQHDTEQDRLDLDNRAKVRFAKTVLRDHAAQMKDPEIVDQ